MGRLKQVPRFLLRCRHLVLDADDLRGFPAILILRSLLEYLIPVMKAVVSWTVLPQVSIQWFLLNSLSFSILFVASWLSSSRVNHILPLAVEKACLRGRTCHCGKFYHLLSLITSYTGLTAATF